MDIPFFAPIFWYHPTASPFPCFPWVYAGVQHQQAALTFAHGALYITTGYFIWLFLNGLGLSYPSPSCSP